MRNEIIKLCWWNTALSPKAQPRATTEEAEKALEILDTLISKHSADFIALGEVCESDLQYFAPLFQQNGYELHSGVEKSGRSTFSSGFAIKRRKLTLSRGTNIVYSSGRSNYRLAQQIFLQTTGSLQDTFCVFVSHWPSRRFLSANHADRLTMGYELRRSAESIKEAQIQNIVFLGDFNDEPFDQSIAEHLKATRDRDLVLQSPWLYYNPFWRHLCHPERSSPSKAPLERGSWGSYFHIDGASVRWRTFDQMIFSSNFLNGGIWHLDEENTGVVDHPSLTKLVESRNSNFDHLPILSTIERISHA